MSRTSFAPIGRPQRLVSIDALRGFALLGIILVNAAFFALPLSQSTESSLEGHASLDWWTIIFVRLFAEQKFIAMFSMLFGVGLAIQYERARARNAPFFGFAYRRLGVLAVFGVIHAVGLWYGDILLFYAIIGAVLVLLLPRSPRTLILLGGIALLVSGILTPVWFLLDHLSPTLVDEPLRETLRGLEAMKVAEFNPSHAAWTAAEIEAHANGPIADSLLFNGVIWLWIVVIMLLGFSWYIAAMFLFGAAMWKTGFFSGDGPGVQWRRPLIVWGLPAGFLLELLRTATSFDGPPLWVQVLGEIGHQIGAPLMMLGVVSIVVTVLERRTIPGAKYLAATGRMSLTAYLLETVLFLAVVRFWGLGLFGSLSRFELLGVSIGLYAMVTVFCWGWQRVLGVGPVEWLWRTLAYLRPPRWKTRPIARP